MTERSARAVRYLDAIRGTDTVARFGHVTRITSTYLEADGPGVPLGSLCMVGGQVIAEVVRSEVGRVTLVPYAAGTLCVGDRVELHSAGASVMTGQDLLGRVVDPLGQALDGLPAAHLPTPWPLAGRMAAPLDRITPTVALPTGYRAIDALLTLGVGQRVGVFAGSGVGKTTLLAGLVRQVEADVCVLCMVGERGREAQDFWHEVLDEPARQRSAMIVASSDQPAVLRARSVLAALAHAEFFRAQGRHVLLVIDSITRYAMALREIGLAAGEPPTVRAYTPNVFAALPKVVERCGALRGGGAITAVLSVLAESDDIDDPMAETLRALLDGHLVLSRSLAERGHFPALDVSRSVSRVAHLVADPEHRRRAMDAASLLSTYEASRALIESGFHVEGADPALDRARRLRPRLLDFLRQPADAPSSMATTLAALADVLGGAP